MSRQRKRRGVSIGTIIMLVLTVVVTGSMLSILPRLLGQGSITIDTSQVLEALNLGDAIPALSLKEIPLVSGPTQEPSVIAPPQETVAPTQAPTATPVIGGTVTLTLGGSINMDEGVRQSGYYSATKEYDFTEALSLISGEMQSDLTMVTFENLVVPGSKVSSLIAPGDIMKNLAAAGIDVVALGFSQAYDQGLSGVSSTVAAAKQARLTTLGAYESAEDAANLRIVTVQNVKIALLHYTESLSSKGKSAMKKDGHDFAVPLMQADKTIFGIEADMAAAKAQGAELIVVSLDWNSVTKSTPSKDQIAIAQQVADAGADIIIGTGTRVAQPVTWLTAGSRRVLCAYSLGSLLNDGRKDGNVASLLLQLTVTSDGAGRITFDRVAYTPTYIWRYKLDGKYYYRVVASDKAAPIGMGDDQAGYKDKAFTNIQKTLGDDTPLVVR